MTPEAPEAPAASPRVGTIALVAVALLVAFALFLVSDHLDDEVWHDEAYTLLHYADEGPGKPFRVYDLPNNHVLLSSALVLWRSALGDGLFTLRLLPASTFVVALVLLVVAVQRLAGRLRPALLAGLLFATSHAALVHATLLRGYGPSALPITGALLALVERRRGRGLGAAIAYVLCGALAVGLVPTNALALVALGAWALVGAAADGDRREVARTAALAVLGTCAGGAFYVAIAGQVLAASGALTTGLTAAGVLGQVASGLLLGLAWLAPLVVAGGVLLLRRAREEGRGALALDRAGGALALLGLVLLLPVGAALALPTVPFARNFTPLAPLLFAALALVVEPALEAADRRRPRAGWALFALVEAGLAGAAVWRERLRAWEPELPAVGPATTTADPYFRHDGFQPSAVVDRLDELARAGPLVVLLDDTDAWAFLAHWRADIPAGLYVAEGRPLEGELLARAERSRVVLVAPSAARARRLAAMAGLPAGGRLELEERIGLFELHRWVR